MIEIRKYQESDAPDLWAIFYHTVRNVNLRDYSQAQVEAWAPDGFSSEIWQRKMNLLSPFVAEIDGKIVGYSDLQENGLIDHFFCHHEHQGRGVGRQLMEHVLRIVHISEHSDQSFRDYPITHFGLNRSLIPRLSDHF